MYVEHLAQELAAHLVLTRPLVCVDLEATGIWPGHDRIVQIATASISPDGSVSTWSSLVNPERSIPPCRHGYPWHYRCGGGVCADFRATSPNRCGTTV